LRQTVDGLPFFFARIPPQPVKKSNPSTPYSRPAIPEKVVTYRHHVFS
jgi:hypothetical protein